MVKVSGKLTQEEILAVIGDPKEWEARWKQSEATREAFRRDAKWLLATYPDEWVCYHDGAFQAHAKDHDDLLREIDARSIPRTEALIKWVEATPLNLIL